MEKPVGLDMGLEGVAMKLQNLIRRDFGGLKEGQCYHSPTNVILALTSPTPVQVAGFAVAIKYLGWEMIMHGPHQDPSMPGDYVIGLAPTRMVEMERGHKAETKGLQVIAFVLLVSTVLVWVFK